jgi:hypothetical protein
LSAWRAPAQPNVLLLDYTNTWRFHTNNLDPGFNPGDAWTSPEFVDSQWPAGQGLFGYETSPEEYALFAPFNTYIPSPFTGSQEFTGPISTYFRTHFSWDLPPANVILNFTNAVDDGLIVYLNGVELYSYNVPAGDRPLPWNLLSLPGGSTPLGEAVPVITNLLAPSLVMGDNVLAVGLYQQALTTSDDVFGMRLTATPARTLVLDPTQPSNQVSLTFTPVTLRAVASASPLPAYQWYEEGELIPGATAASYTFINTNSCGASLPHAFYCVVSNPLGSSQTRTAIVSFVTDDLPLEITRVVGSGDLSNVVVEFNNVVDKTSAEDPFNYLIQATNGDGFVPWTAHQLSDGRSVVLNLTNALASGASYLLVPTSFIIDLCGRELPTRPAPFDAWTQNPCPGVTFEAYFSPPGSPNSYPPGQEPWRVLFPDHPSEVLRLVRAFNSLEAYDENQHTRYGGRMRGIFIPPISGGWRLFLRSTEPGELWFNPAGPGADGRMLAATMFACCLAFQEPPFPQTSARFELMAGRAYYLEADWSANAGGFCQVAARLEDDPTPANQLSPIPIAWLGSATVPGVAGSVTITRKPVGAILGENQTTTLSVGIDTDAPVCYQWLRDGVEIPGAIRPEYRYEAQEGEVLIRFNVRVTLLGAEPVVSDPAWVSVSLGYSPTIHHVRLVAGETNLTVTWFWEYLPLDPRSAENPEHYLVDGEPATSARIVDETNVVLSLSAPLAACQAHTLSVMDVTNLFGSPLSPNPTFLVFQASSLPLVRRSEPQLWRYQDDGIDLGAAWRAPTYDDSSWKTGAGVLAWEPDNNLPDDWPVGTVLSQFTNFVDRPTFYFRTHFQLPTHPSTITALRWREMVDDGCAVYLNGQRVHLNRLEDPFDFVTHSTTVAAEPHVVEGPFELPASSLHQGDNVLAVEVHQWSTLSPDIVFGGELAAEVGPCAVGLEIVRLSAEEVRLDWPDATYHLQWAREFNGPWTTDASAASGVRVDLGSGERYFRLAR